MLITTFEVCYLTDTLYDKLPYGIKTIKDDTHHCKEIGCANCPFLLATNCETAFVLHKVLQTFGIESKLSSIERNNCQFLSELYKTLRNRWKLDPFADLELLNSEILSLYNYEPDYSSSSAYENLFKMYEAKIANMAGLTVKQLGARYTEIINAWDDERDIVEDNDNDREGTD